MQLTLQTSTRLWQQWPVYLVWLILAVYYAVPAWPDPLVAGPLGQDDALRLVQVRDLLAGQGWFDLVQHRMQPSSGLDMHWSRLIDAPMAALSYAFGERAMLFLWPGLLIGGFLFAAIFMVRRLFEPIEIVSALLVAALCLVPLSYFAPARIDHHNIQLILAMVMAGAIARPFNTLAPAVLAALAAALMMAIGLETLPYIVVGLIIIAGSWALGFSQSKPLAVFGNAFAVLTLLAWAAQTNIQTQMAVCDMLSPVYVWPIMIGGFGLVLSSYIGKNQNAAVRFGLLAVTGLAATGAFYEINPACLGGPMAQVPMELQDRWLTTVAEAQPIWSVVTSAPVLAIERYGPPLFALLLGLFLAFKYRIHRYGLVVCLAFLAMACLVSVVQLRGTLFAHAYTIGIFALAIDIARKQYQSNQSSLTAILAMALAFITCQSLSYTVAASFVPAQPQLQPTQSSAVSTGISQEVLTVVDRECAGADVRQAIANLGDSLIAVPVFYGAQVLEMGTASVLAGPYHRATDAIFDSLRLFEDGLAAEREVLSRRKPNYLALCLTSDDTVATVAKYPNSLSARLKNGQTPQWLQPLPKAGRLSIYRVSPDL